MTNVPDSASPAPAQPIPAGWYSGVGVLVYVIGRTVIVRRRSGHGVAPLVVAIAIVVIGIVLGAVHNAQMMGPILEQFDTGSVVDSGYLDS